MGAVNLSKPEIKELKKYLEENFKCMANRIVEAYDEGKREEVMTMEMPIRSAISSLNALYEHSIHHRRFYKDLSPIFGDDYIFTQKDLRISTKIEEPCILYRNLDKTFSVIYYVCLTTIILSILTKAIQTKQITHNRYKAIAGKYLREKFMVDILREQEKRGNDPDAIKPTVSKTLANSENERLHPHPKPIEKKKSKPKKKKEYRPWVHIIYTPMGNKR